MNYELPVNVDHLCSGFWPFIAEQFTIYT